MHQSSFRPYESSGEMVEFVVMEHDYPKLGSRRFSLHFGEIACNRLETAPEKFAYCRLKDNGGTQAFR